MQSKVTTRTRCAVMALVLACLPLSTLPLRGLMIYGSIYGQVTDPTGSVVQTPPSP